MAGCFCTGACKTTGSCSVRRSLQEMIDMQKSGEEYGVNSPWHKEAVAALEEQRQPIFYQIGRKWVKI